MNHKEQEALIEEIREKYDTLVGFYRKKPEVLLDFEKRLMLQLSSSVDPEPFLLMEREIVNALIDREESFFQEELEPLPEPAGPSFADKIIEELEQKQEKYPYLNIHEYAAPEVCRLYGALVDMAENSWPEIIMILDKTLPGMRNGALVELEHTLHRLTSTKGGGIPASLERYHRLLDYSEATNHELQKESQGLIKDAAFFLHDLRKYLKIAKDREMFRDKISRWLETIELMISDFRLKDIHRADQ